MPVACAMFAAPALVAALVDAGIAATPIGSFTAPGTPLLLRRAGREAPLPDFAADEVTRLFGP